MACFVCRYRWCWICGHSVDHWVHRISFSPFSCKKAPSDPKSIVCFSLLFIVGIILLPVLIFMIIFGLCFYYSMRAFFRLIKHCKFLKSVIGFIIISPIFVCYFIVVVMISAALGGLGCGLGILPALALHVYLFVRTIYWWRRSRVNKMEAAEKVI